MLSNIEGPKKILSKLYDSLIGFIYPPQCIICNRLHEGDLFFICPECETKLDMIDCPICLKCGAAIPAEYWTCPICKGKPLILRVWAMGAFDDFYRPLIHAFKYEGIISAGKYLSSGLAEIIKANPHSSNIHAVIPIPLHPSRQRKRGFNQSRLIANIIALKLGVRHLPYDLIRVKKTRDQTGLNHLQRIENMRGAFTWLGKNSIAGKHVLLVDDVTTTGATAMEAAKVLKAAKASHVSLGVIAAAGRGDAKTK